MYSEKFENWSLFPARKRSIDISFLCLFFPAVPLFNFSHAKLKFRTKFGILKRKVLKKNPTFHLLKDYFVV